MGIFTKGREKSHSLKLRNSCSSLNNIKAQYHEREDGWDMQHAWCRKI